MSVSGLCVLEDGTVLDGIAAPVLSRVLTVAADLFDELGAADATVTAPCAVMVVSGAAAALDRGLDESDGCCGQLWTRLVTLYPSRAFPEADPVPSPDVLSWAVTIEVGLARPAPVIAEVDGSAVIPSAAQEQDAAAVALVDAAVLREALLGRYADAEDVAVLLGAYTPFGPDGGIVGGSFTATIQVP